MHPILKLLVQRIALGLLLLLAVSAVIFLGVEALPGDTAQAILGQSATPQALENLPEGPVMAKIPKVIKPPVGEVYHANETPRGELGFHIVSDGSTKPYRLHIRRPTFYNLGCVNALCQGVKIADVAAVLAVLDPCMGEADA